MESFIVYWILSTLVGTIWLLIGYADKNEYISVGDILGCLLISGMLAWALIVVWLLDAAKIKIKRNGKVQKQSAGGDNGGHEK